MRKRVLVVTSMDKPLDELVSRSNHKILAIWAAECAERVLHYFEDKYPDDNRPRTAIESCRMWARTGIFKMAAVRKASLDSHAAARQADADANIVARAAARAAGQAAATPHVPRHALGAATYAASAIRDAADPADANAAVDMERAWQYQRLLELGDNSRR